MTYELIVVFALILIILIRIYEKKTNAICKSNKRLDGKTALVTGGTAGMGLEIATDFARRGAKVIVACPFEGEGIAGKKHIINETGNNKVLFKLLDLGSIDSVRKFTEDFLKTEERLDILINNAGVGVPYDFLTKDGMRFIMQVNYFGHFLLTLLLLPLLKKSGSSKDPSRIVNTSSIMHHIGIWNIRELNDGFWLSAQVYGKSKLCLFLFARELTRKLANSNVVINSIDPGAVGTGIFNSAGKLVGPLLTFLFSNMYKTPWEGAQTALHVALDSRAGEVSGEFFKNCRQSRAMRWAYNERLEKRVWDKSLVCVKMSSDELNQILNSESS